VSILSSVYETNDGTIYVARSGLGSTYTLVGVALVFGIPVVAMSRVVARGLYEIGTSGNSRSWRCCSPPIDSRRIPDA
jgi:hypothetical protein